MANATLFIVYVYFYPMGHRFFGHACYVGKGMPSRPNDHKKGRSTNRHLRSLFFRYRDLPMVVLHTKLTLTKANMIEVALIKALGRRDLGTGLLVNLTDGGDGAPGAVRSAATRAKQRANGLGRRHTAKTRTQMSVSRKGRTITPTWRKNLSIAMTGKKRPAEVCEKIRIKQTGKSPSKVTRAKIGAKSLGRTPSVATRKKIGEKLAGRLWWSTPDGQSYMAKEPRSPDDVRGRMKFRTDSKELWTPKRRAAQAQRMQEKWSDPEKRKTNGQRISLARRKNKDVKQAESNPGDEGLTS